MFETGGYRFLKPEILMAGPADFWCYPDPARLFFRLKNRDAGVVVVVVVVVGGGRRRRFWSWVVVVAAKGRRWC